MLCHCTHIDQFRLKLWTKLPTKDHAGFSTKVHLANSIKFLLIGEKYDTLQMRYYLCESFGTKVLFLIQTRRSFIWSIDFYGAWRSVNINEVLSSEKYSVNANKTLPYMTYISSGHVKKNSNPGVQNSTHKISEHSI